MTQQLWSPVSLCLPRLNNRFSTPAECSNHISPEYRMRRLTINAGQVHSDLPAFVVNPESGKLYILATEPDGKEPRSWLVDFDHAPSWGTGDGFKDELSSGRLLGFTNYTAARAVSDALVSATKRTERHVLSAHRTEGPVRHR